MTKYPRPLLMGFAFWSLLVLAAPNVANAQKRSDLDDALDKFAAAHFDKIQPRSIADNVEYCGYFGYDRSNRLIATRATRGEQDSCEPAEPPQGFDILASYHTHGAYTQEADTEVPSIEDLQGDIEEEIDGYIATPGGRIWVNSADERITFLLCGQGCVRADQRFRECNAYPPGEEYTLAELRHRAEEDPGDC